MSDFEEWFKKVFPEYKSGYMYGKKAIEIAYNAGKEAAEKEKQEKAEDENNGKI